MPAPRRASERPRGVHSSGHLTLAKPLFSWAIGEQIVPIGIHSVARATHISRVPHVLIVDDDLLVGSVRRLLQPGFSVVGKSRAADALALLDVEDDYDALVLDIDDAADREMYGELLRDASRARRTMFLTSATDPRAEEFLSSSRRPWLAKPFAAKDLEAEIRRILSDSKRRTA